MANGSLLNFEGTPSYVLSVQVTDAGGMSSTGPVTINLVNANEAPTAIALSGSSVNEGIDTSGGYAVGVLITTDVDVPDSHTYSIVGGTDASKFSTSGAQLLIADGILDFETKPSYQVTVRSTDAGGLFVDRSFTISVTNLNEAPSVTAITNRTIGEGSSTGTIAFTIGDPETAAGSLSVTAASNDQLRIPNANLVLAGTGANRTVVVTPPIDAYGGPVTITLSVSDGVNTTLRTFDVTIDPVADHLVVVDTASDIKDGDTSSIDALLMDKGADGFISLREAILAANGSVNAGSPDQIRFNIAGAGLHTINLLSALPAITDAVVLDATTQPGFAGAPIIELNGAAAGAAADGLTLLGGNSTVRGLVINRFGGSGIHVGGTGGNLIQGNYVGLDATGNADLGNAQYGIWVTSNSNVIGGTTAGDRNVISGNNVDGIHIDGVSGNLVQGNYVGTNATGTGAVGNGEDGIWLDNASSNTIGGTVAGARNVVSGNNWSGIALSGLGGDNVIQGNYIGVNASGTGPLGNLVHGISIAGTSAAMIGGATAGAGNTIAFNLQDGVAITGGVSHSVLGNSIYNNTGLAIDINDNGVTANDAGDGDLGTNLGMNFPVLYSAVVAAGNVTITGEARPGATVQFFKAAVDPSGYGEGQTLLGSAVVSGAVPGSLDSTARQFSFTFAAGVLGGRRSCHRHRDRRRWKHFGVLTQRSRLRRRTGHYRHPGLRADHDGGRGYCHLLRGAQHCAHCERDHRARLERHKRRHGKRRRAHVHDDGLEHRANGDHYRRVRPGDGRERAIQHRAGGGDQCGPRIQRARPGRRIGGQPGRCEQRTDQPDSWAAGYCTGHGAGVLDRERQCDLRGRCGCRFQPGRSHAHGQPGPAHARHYHRAGFLRR